MDLKADDGERFAITITQNWRGALELWVKKKCKKHASAVISHLQACLYKLHGDKVLTLFLADDQKLAVETKWE